MIRIHSDHAPAAIGPYSQAIAAGGFLYISGQIPVDPETGRIDADDIAGQTERACRNVGEILNAAGTGFDRVVKTTCYLRDMRDFSAFNAVYEKCFISRPARSCVAVRELPKGALCEIETIACLLEDKENE